MHKLTWSVLGFFSVVQAFESSAFAATKDAKPKAANPTKVAAASSTYAANSSSNASKPESVNLMTSSNSVAAGMRMAAKYMPLDSINRNGAHPIVSLRQNKSDAQFDLGLGTESLNTKEGSTSATDLEMSIMHIGLGATMVSTQGLRFGGRIEIAEDPIKVKVKRPIVSSKKIKVSQQHVSFFAAAGLTPNFGLGLQMVMIDSKIGDKKDSATLVSPAFMTMVDQTEVVFDLIQSDQDVSVDGHWRVSVVHLLEGSTFATGEMTRVKPNSGDDYWSLALGGRKKYSNVASAGAELLYNQQHDNDSSRCSMPSLLGLRGDIDHGLTESQIVSFGAQYRFGKCSEKGEDQEVKDLEFKGAFTAVF